MKSKPAPLMAKGAAPKDKSKAGHRRVAAHGRKVDLEWLGGFVRLGTYGIAHTRSRGNGAGADQRV